MWKIQTPNVAIPKVKAKIAKIVFLASPSNHQIHDLNKKNQIVYVTSDIPILQIE